MNTLPALIRRLPPALLATTWLAAPLAPAAPSRPNVLVILADDLGFSDLGCYGGEIPTPNIDRLAAGGVRFSAFYTSARCCPTRASLITGLHPHEAGIGSFATAQPEAGKGPAYTGHLLPDTATLAEILGDAGYSTWMVGKWHMGSPGPVERGFQNYYGYRNLLAHSEDQWNPQHYARLPAGTTPELTFQPGTFYATDAFTDYALEFLRQARSNKPASPPDQTAPGPQPGGAGQAAAGSPQGEAAGPRQAAGRKPQAEFRRPWFLYLAHSSPHFPIQAPKESINRHLATYRRGWDVLRAERLERQKKSGLVPADLPLPPRAEVPVDRDDIANGFPGQPNPAWDSLPADRREDLARRMATFAAMVEHLDRGVGRLLADLQQHGELDHTLIFFLSDNGACYEWGPFGFDGPSRKGTTTLHTGPALDRFGQAGTHSSYGSAWANLGNTPLAMYKHFCHEGGIASPLIVHWPAGLRAGISNLKSQVSDSPTHVMDIVPTVCAATGVPYPNARGTQPVKPASGVSLLPACRGLPLPERPLAFEHQEARGLRLGEWKLVWGKRQTNPLRWELYNLRTDRTEQHDLADQQPEKLQQLILEWTRWARRVGASPLYQNDRTDDDLAGPENPPVAKRPLTITCEFEPGADTTGVLLAHGGNRHGYALHLLDGRPAFDVRLAGKVTRLAAKNPLAGRTTLTASLDADTMTLAINGREVARQPSPGLLPEQPQDDLNIGRDSRSAAGDYQPPNPFEGTIHAFEVTPGEPAR